jgi:hypothetical protein
VLFRGVVHQFIGGWGLKTVLLSAVLFGLPHAVSVGAGVGELLANAFTVTMVVGVPFAALRERGLGLAPLIVLHGLIDVVAFLGTDSLGVLDASNQMLVTQSVIAAIIGTCWLVWFSYKRPKALDAE